MRKTLLPLCFLLASCASTTQQGATGIERKQLMLVSSAEVEKASLTEYQNALGEASKAGKLNNDKATLERIRVIADRLIPQVAVFRPDALQWQWEVNLLTTDELNAYCAPGGKIMFYTGIIQKLNLSDDEIAAIMGHEMAHALREHGRERVSQAYAQQVAMNIVLSYAGLGQGSAALMQTATQVALTLPNSRGQESEADVMGLELLARAGYNPEAAVTLWQKMAKAGAGSGPSILSTHPSSPERIAEIQSHLPEVMPLYQQAKVGFSKTPARVVPRT